MLLLRRTATSNATSAMELDASSSRCPGTERWGAWPSPVGLTLGILAALCAQVAVIAYHYVRLRWCATRRVQTEPRPYPFGDGIKSHLANPGGILMMVAYLCLYWMLDLMPCSYYHFDGGVRWWMVGAQTCCQDFLMFVLHYFEHKGPLGPDFYQRSHKPHHRFVNPRLFDAFDGSVPDTFCMILIPLAITAQVLHANVWEYMLFGSLWSGWLCLIHSEIHHPWDGLFSRLGLGTAADHHVHHKTFVRRACGLEERPRRSPRASLVCPLSPACRSFAYSVAPAALLVRPDLQLRAHHDVVGLAGWHVQGPGDDPRVQ